MTYIIKKDELERRLTFSTEQRIFKLLDLIKKGNEVEVRAEARIDNNQKMTIGAKLLYKREKNFNFFMGFQNVPKDIGEIIRGRIQTTFNFGLNFNY